MASQIRWIFLDGGVDQQAGVTIFRKSTVFVRIEPPSPRFPFESLGVTLYVKRSYIKYSPEQIKEAVLQSSSWRQVINYLNPNNKGYKGSECHLKKKAQGLGIDFSHFPGQGWRRDKKFDKKPISYYLCKNGPLIKSNHLKNRLFTDNLKERKCEKCLKVKWFDIEIPLELHHIDKDPNNNTFENLQILCSNCHSYVHKTILKKEKKKPKKYLKKKNKKCFFCQKPCVYKFCSYKCSNLSSRKVIRPTKNTLNQLVWEQPCSQLAKKFGVSDNAITKWCKTYNIEKPPRGYWAKKRDKIF